MTKDYEIMFITPVDCEEECKNFVDKICKHINSIGKLLKLDDWGPKRLAYEINMRSTGHYYLLTFETSRVKCAEGIRELDRLCKTDDYCLRHMIIRKGE